MTYLDRNHKTFLLTIIGLTIAIQGVAFNLGAFGILFFDYLLPIGAISTALLCGVWVLSRDERPHATFHKII